MLNLGAKTHKDNMANVTRKDRTEVKESVKKPMRGRPVNNTEWVINASSTIEALALHLGVQTQNSSLGLSVRAGKPYKGWEFEYV